ncbi:MAG: Mrp/NBP35 family ATP-binding protein [Sphaerochaetaceae bacterium]
MQHYKAMHTYDAKVKMNDEQHYFYEVFVKGDRGMITQVSFVSDASDDVLQALDSLCEYAEGKEAETLLATEETAVFADGSKAPVSFKTGLSAFKDAVQSYLLKEEKKHPMKIVNNSKEHQESKERRTIMVISGKGGVGKSTVSLNIAVSLAQKGYKVGLVDVDVHGPSIPVMLNLPDVDVMKGDHGIVPVILPDVYNLKVMSLGFMLEHPDDPVVWRGPLKNQMIEQFLNDVDWGDIDYLIVDNPPGTGDEPLSTAQQLKGKGEALLVTTPQQVSTADVSRSINFCHKLDLPIVGLIENMSGFVCPHCQTVTNIFRTGGGDKLSKYYHVPLLGSIPLDANVGIAGDVGIPYVQRFENSPIALAYDEICEAIVHTRRDK